MPSITPPLQRKAMSQPICNPTAKSLAAFYYNNELHIRIIPSKPLFNSTLIHEVINRGDVFAMRVKDQQLTICRGVEAITPAVIDITNPLKLNQEVQSDLFK